MLSPRAAPSAPRRPRFAHGWLTVSIGLGLWYWWTAFTDYSLAGSWPDIVMPLVLWAVGILGWRSATGRHSRRRRSLIRAALLPALVGGGLQIATTLLGFIPPFTLGGLWQVTELLSESRIQEVVSPDGRFLAAVDFRDVGAYSGGHGRLFIRVSPRQFPLIEREVWAGTTYQATRASHGYIRWRDNHTLAIPEVPAPIAVDSVSFRWPESVRAVIAIGQLVGQEAARQHDNETQTGPVRDVPLFPAAITDEAIEYEPVVGPPGSMFRAFTIPDHTADDVGAWYKEALSHPPWSIVWVARRATAAQTIRSQGAEHLVYYCIEAQRDEGSQPRRLYSWDLIWGDQGNGVRVIIDSPPDTVFADCQHPSP